MVMANVVHYYTSCHLSALTALKSIDLEFEAVSASLTPEFEAAGAHYVIDSVADLAPVLNDIDRRLAAGERP